MHKPAALSASASTGPDRASGPGLPRLLHAGAGTETLPAWLVGFQEIRLDINPATRPDIVGDMRRLDFQLPPFKAVYCNHALEHLYPHEVVPCLEGFRRILEPGGVCMIFVPDLEDVRATDEILLDTPAGPVAGLDMIYGFREAIRENPYMAHHSGFTAASLADALTGAGFAQVSTKRLADYNLMGAGVKP